MENHAVNSENYDRIDKFITVGGCHYGIIDCGSTDLIENEYRRKEYTVLDLDNGKTFEYLFTECVGDISFDDVRWLSHEYSATPLDDEGIYYWTDWDTVPFKEYDDDTLDAQKTLCKEILKYDNDKIINEMRKMCIKFRHEEQSDVIADVFNGKKGVPSACADLIEESIRDYTDQEHDEGEIFLTNIKKEMKPLVKIAERSENGFTNFEDYNKVMDIDSVYGGCYIKYCGILTNDMTKEKFNECVAKQEANGKNVEKLKELLKETEKASADIKEKIKKITAGMQEPEK